ncbi:ATP-binding cassette domain-containing protein [Microbaculum marinisediminis]|uniref:ABC transporter ATP-binding protein n=1 Tax=Microbaculum marinisediminis TaxID=2931392 RepID=A0AAW5QYF2_9HYPH|nr:ABC transporter ATP-binding protein [Microbaculum sp. A6E488]MCT8972753.1 ABC transporter ATP-binding protein [Microbaculum sp. A6E488]
MTALFEVEGVKIALPDPNRKTLLGQMPMVEILHGIDLTIEEGTVVGLVGESGSGKSTLGRALVRLLEPVAGSIRFAGTDITHLDDAALRPYRRDLQVIFQDPLSALNPRLTIGTIIGRPLMLHGLAKGRREARRLAEEALDHVGLPTAFATRYPHELSGGQRQRVGIARAIATKPRFVLADEIVSGLDVSSQAQILTLLAQLKAEMKLTIVFISHDLSVVRRLCDRVVVLRHGEVLENRPTGPLFEHPEHPYTAELKAAIPLPEVDGDWLGA